jgi:hypothetical protein
MAVTVHESRETNRPNARFVCRHAIKNASGGQHRHDDHADPQCCQTTTQIRRGGSDE